MPSLFHEIDVDCSADAAYKACLDVAKWPSFMPAVRSATFLEQGPEWDVVEITAEANDRLWTWTSRRLHDPKEKTIKFQRIGLPDGVTVMEGRWCIVSAPTGGCSIQLHHEFAVEQGRADVEEFLTRSIRSNASRDLEALARYAPGADR